MEGSAEAVFAFLSSSGIALTSFTHGGVGPSDLYAWRSGMLMKHSGSEICPSCSILYPLEEGIVES